MEPYTSPTPPAADQVSLSGVWLPLVTPFRDGELDEASVRRLVRHYAGQPVDGFILAATTGEALTLDESETERLVTVVAAELAGLGRRVPVLLGLSGSDTRKGVKAIRRTAGLVADGAVDGYLIACPYYTRPSQRGLLEHFGALADAASLPIVVYNIPYRTGVNMSNDTLLRLAEHPRIVGVKDCCADLGQSLALLRDRPAGFSVMTGEDALFFTLLAHGGDGGIMASAHVRTADFAAVRRLVTAGDLGAARAVWDRLVTVPQALFAEPSPSPIKHWLWRAGLIDSAEVRLPMTPITEALAARLDGMMEG